MSKEWVLVKYPFFIISRFLLFSIYQEKKLKMALNKKSSKIRLKFRIDFVINILNNDNIEYLYTPIYIVKRFANWQVAFLRFEKGGTQM